MARGKAKDVFPTPAQKEAQKIAIKRAQMTPPSQRSAAQKLLIRKFGGITDTAAKRAVNPVYQNQGTKQKITGLKEPAKQDISGRTGRVTRGLNRGGSLGGGGFMDQIR